MTSLLDQLIAFSQAEWHGMKLGLEKVSQACEILGHPERSYKSIHIAGTNGKGSVAALLHSILSKAGYKVGLYTSPHLLCLNERIKVGDRQISNEELEGLLEELKNRNLLGKLESFPANSADAVKPPFPSHFSFFEICTLLAFLFFEKNQVDWAIIEVGLGGRLDATNVIVPEVSILTEISHDHMEILGYSLEEIAAEKAGIIKNNIPVVCGARAGLARKIIHQTAIQRQAPFYPVLPPETHSDNSFDWNSFTHLKVGLQGVHQVWNAATALTALGLIFKDGVKGMKEDLLREGLESVQWPGRMEWIQKNPPILIDGAHNPSGVQSLVESLRSPSFSSVKKWKVLFGAVRGKEVSTMLESLEEIASSFVFCRLQNPRSVAPQWLQDFIPETIPTSAVQSLSEAYPDLIDQLEPEEGLLITGSLYLVGELKALIKK